MLDPKIGGDLIPLTNNSYASRYETRVEIYFKVILMSLRSKMPKK